MGTFGKTTIGPDRDAIAANYKQVSKYTLSETGTITKLTIYLDNQGPGSDAVQPIKAVVYVDSGGSPTALLGTSSEFNIPRIFDGAWSQWQDFAFTTPFVVFAGDYWLGFIAGNPGSHGRFGKSTVTNNRKYSVDTYSDGATNPFGSPSGTDAFQIDVYATYMPAFAPQAIIL